MSQDTKLLITFIETEKGWDYDFNKDIKTLSESLGLDKVEAITKICEEIKELLAE